MPSKKRSTKKNGRTKKTEPTYTYTLTLTEAVIQGFIEDLEYRIHRGTRDAVQSYKEGDVNDYSSDLYALAKDVRLHDALQHAYANHEHTKGEDEIPE
jgi:hypothetical protein